MKYDILLNTVAEVLAKHAAEDPEKRIPRKGGAIGAGVGSVLSVARKGSGLGGAALGGAIGAEKGNRLRTAGRATVSGLGHGILGYIPGVLLKNRRLADAGAQAGVFYGATRGAHRAAQIHANKKGDKAELERLRKSATRLQKTAGIVGQARDVALEADHAVSALEGGKMPKEHRTAVRKVMRNADARELRRQRGRGVSNRAARTNVLRGQATEIRHSLENAKTLVRARPKRSILNAARYAVRRSL